MDKKPLISLILTGINTLLLAGLVVYTVTNQGPSQPQRAAQPAPQRPQLAKNVDMDKLLQGAKFYGNKNAPVTVVLFNSFTCGFCAKSREVLNQVATQYSKDVLIAFKHFNRGEADIPPAIAMECAGQMDKAWQMYNTIFQNGLTQDYSGYAQSIGLNVTRFKECYNDPKTRQITIEQTTEGRGYGITGTPAFVINGDVMVGYRPFPNFEAVLKNYM